MPEERMRKEEQWLLNERFGGEKNEDFQASVHMLRNGEPLAYLIGNIPFGPLTIHLDSKPLIPRSETEFWTQIILEEYDRSNDTAIPMNTTRVLDLCSGSGCIGLLTLSRFRDVNVDFVEIEENHHSTIRKNARVNMLPLDRVRIFGGDLFEYIPSDSRYDLILSNPPYIDPALDRTEESVKTHEPHRALYGGENGMDVIARIIAEAPTFLTQNGLLVIEHEPEQCVAIATNAEQSGLIVRHRNDQYGIARYSIFKRK